MLLISQGLDKVSNMTYFKKSFPQNPVSLSNGRSVRFEDFGNNLGFYKTDDPVTIAEFKLCQQQSRGGIENSSEEEYNEAVKKKPLSLSYSRGSIEERQTSGLVTNPQLLPPNTPKLDASPAAVAGPSAPVVDEAPPEPKVVKRNSK